MSLSNFVPISSCVLTNTFEWFKRAVSTPTTKNLHVQLGVHFEEVAEMLEEIDSPDLKTSMLLTEAGQALDQLANHLKMTRDLVLEIDEPLAMLDAICDQLVTVTGVAHMMGMDPIGGLNEVNRSNWSKFVDGQPLWNENGKIIKGPDYSKPDLQPFL